MPAFTVAPWGGLHENVLHGALALATAGHKVTLVLRPGLISEKARDNGLSVVEVDWDEWEETADRIRNEISYDLILAQPQKSRELALHINQGRNQPLYVMFHGYYSDQAAEWNDKVTGFLTVTPSLSEFLHGFAKVEPWKMHVVPNGVPMDRFDYPLKSFAEKTKGNRATVVIPSRIDKDKIFQQEALKELVKCIRSSKVNLEWEISVLGDGPEKRRFERLSSELVKDTPNVNITFTGWVDSEQVPTLMNNAVFTIGAGRGALQSLAVGTPVLAAGKHGIAGFQFGNNLRVGLWSNFGDYPFQKAPITEIEPNFSYLMEPENYTKVQANGRLVVAAERSQDAVDKLLVSSLSY